MDRRLDVGLVGLAGRHAIGADGLVEPEGRSTRCLPDYLERVGGDDEAYQQEAAEKLRVKWEHLLPICRGRRDEAYECLRIESLLDQVGELEGWARSLQEENAAMKAEMEKASAHFEKLERLLAERQEGPAAPVTPRLNALEKARSLAFMRKKARRRDRGEG